MTSGTVPVNRLILGDNLEIMKTLESESVDLIYLDPPFFSNRNYEVIWGDDGEIRSFKDRWAGGIDHYVTWLKERVVEMYRLLKPTGWWCFVPSFTFLASKHYPACRSVQPCRSRKNGI
ncbi:MAG: hypothetical protein FWG73_08815 [Planctomycetaceae bacterium]|nr:hypothetical protein [Planctomycetaceae bacterium]